MTNKANDDPGKQPQPSTMDAWLFFYVAFGCSVACQLLGAKLSILGAIAAGQVLCLLLPSLLYARWKSGSVMSGLRLQSVAGGVMWRVALLALTFLGVSDLLQQVTQPIIARHFASFIPKLEALMEILTPKSATGLAGNLVIVGLLAPVCEEVFFRGAFQGTLEQRGPVRAILTSALMFAIVHLNPFNFLGIVLIGIALGVVTWRTQSIWPAILWHAVNNSVSTLALSFGGQSFTMPVWLSVMLTVLFVGLAWEFVRHIRRAAPVQLSPLAMAPSLLGRQAHRVAVSGGVVMLLLLVAATVCFGRTRLGSDLLAPDYPRGNIMIYTRGPAFRPSRLKSDDVIIYRLAKGELCFTRILAVDAEKITVIGPANENGERVQKIIMRNDIIGKSFWFFDPGDEIRKLMEKHKS